MLVVKFAISFILLWNFSKFRLFMSENTYMFIATSTFLYHIITHFSFIQRMLGWIVIIIFFIIVIIIVIIIIRVIIFNWGCGLRLNRFWRCWLNKHWCLFNCCLIFCYCFDFTSTKLKLFLTMCKCTTNISTLAKCLIPFTHNSSIIWWLLWFSWLLLGRLKRFCWSWALFHYNISWLRFNHRWCRSFLFLNLFSCWWLLKYTFTYCWLRLKYAFTKSQRIFRWWFFL